MNSQMVACCLGLVLTGADCCMCWKDEKRFLWKSPFKITIVICLYLGMNYLSLLAHMTDLVFTFFSRIKYYNDGLTYEVCVVHYVFRAAVASILCTLLHLIIMLRVHALYAQNRYMAGFMILAFVGRAAVLLWVFPKSNELSEYRSPFNYVCSPAIHFRMCHLVFAIVELTLHAIWCGLTLMKTWRLRDVWASYPIQNLSPVLNRDALLVFGAINGIFAVQLIGTFKATATELIMVCIFPVMTFVTCRSGCRVIIHLQRVSKIEESKEGSEDTACFSTVDWTWDTRTRSM
ncbi:hypothetical protein PM082_022715 [Marasmius tenuissimus]|nr:hypothetical protein PM082_022715 [Marasmius tenuissimus]